MQKSNPENLDRPRHADIQRDSMDDIRELQSAPHSGDVRYRDPNRDRSLGEALWRDEGHLVMWLRLSDAGPQPVIACLWKDY